MFEVVESRSSFPLRYLSDPNINLEPGHIIEIIEINGNPSCTLSDGNKPFGIVGGEKDQFGLIPIWFNSMVIRTDKFEPWAMYHSGSPIYSSKNGLLTTDKFKEGSLLLGHVVTGPNQGQNFLEVSWI